MATETEISAARWVHMAQEGLYIFYVMLYTPKLRMSTFLVCKVGLLQEHESNEGQMHFETPSLCRN